MPPRHLRAIFFGVFFVGITGIFTAWSEIGGQTTLDAMPWGWKFGLGVGLAAAITLYSAALCGTDTLWNARTAKWLTLTIVLLLGMVVVTFYYALQVQNEPPDEPEGATTSMSSMDPGLNATLPAGLLLPADPTLPADPRQPFASAALSPSSRAV